MFRRFGKSEKEEPTPSYFTSSAVAEETPAVSNYNKMSAKKPDLPPLDLSAHSLLDENKTLGSFQREEPETTLGEGVVFRGELCFERLLRIDGVFEGELISKGKIIIGPKGKVKANLCLKEAVVEGRVEGNITVEDRVELRGEAQVFGDIRAKTLSVDEGVTLVGHVQVMPADRDPSDHLAN